MKIAKYLVCIAFINGFGCNQKSSTTDVEASAARTTTIEIATSRALREKINRDKSVLFVSGNGIRRGLDNDATLELKSDGSMVLWEYKVGPLDFYGHYAISDDGLVSITFKDTRKNKWPEMKVALDNQKQRFLLHKFNGSKENRENKHAGLDDADEFWPFAEPRK